MNSLEPLSPPDEVVPEAGNTPAKPTQPVYPTPLTSEEKTQKLPETYPPAPETEAVAGSNLKQGVTITQYFIPLIAGVFALYVLYQLLIAVIHLSTDALIGGFSGGGSNFALLSRSSSSYLNLIIVFVAVQMILLLLVSYKIYRGSKIALALLTGPAALFLQISLIGHLLSASNFSRSMSMEAGFWILAQIALAILLVLAWTKERNYYFS